MESYKIILETQMTDVQWTASTKNQDIPTTNESLQQHKMIIPVIKLL